MQDQEEAQEAPMLKRKPRDVEQGGAGGKQPQQQQQQQQQQQRSRHIFGESRWRGREDELGTTVNRWVTQVALLSLKCTLVLLRRPVTLLCVLLVPMLTLLVFLEDDGSGGGSGDSATPVSVYVEPISVTGLAECYAYVSTAAGADEDSCVKVVYNNRSSAVQQAMQTFAEENALVWGEDVLQLDSKSDVEGYVADNVGTVEYTVLFSGELGPDSTIQYTILSNSSARPLTARDEAADVDFEALVFQWALERALMSRVVTNSGGSSGVPKIDYTVSYGRFQAVDNLAADDVVPDDDDSNSICAASKRPIGNVKTTAPWAILVPIAITCTMLFQILVDERTDKLVTSLRRLGVMDSAYWASWLLVLLVVFILNSVIAATAAHTYASHVLQNTSFGPLFATLLMYQTAFMTDFMFLSTLCSKQSITTACMFITFVAMGITLAVTQGSIQHYNYISEGGEVKCASTGDRYTSVFNDGGSFLRFLVLWMPWFWAGGMLADIMSVTRMAGKTYSISEMYRSYTYDDSDAVFDSSTEDVVPGARMLDWLAYEVVLYLGLAWILGTLLGTGDSDGRASLLAILPQAVRQYLSGSSRVVYEGDTRGQELKRSAEEGSVRAYKVSKTYDQTTALKEVSLTMRKGEVFALLGHNGAGKSTLINVLSGVTVPTHGKVFAFGLDVEVDQSILQQYLGVCPQHDVHFPELTAREHLILYAGLKGLSLGSQLQDAVSVVLERVGLTERENQMSQFYSGGMKRRLSVAMACVGDCSLIFFDEPTTGLDPVSKRQVWDMVNWVKEDRVVVLTTHNMEEADALGDTICFLHGGRVKAIGDSLALKQTFGRGFQVTLTVDAAHMFTVREAVATLLPGAQLEETPLGAWKDTQVVRLGEDPSRASGANDNFSGVATDASQRAVQLTMSQPPRKDQERMEEPLLLGNYAHDRAAEIADSNASRQGADRVLITLSVSRQALGGLPRFFNWISRHVADEEGDMADFVGQSTAFEEQAGADSASTDEDGADGVVAGGGGATEFVLPRHLRDDVHRFIFEWGLSNTTLEQVFLKLCAQHDGKLEATDADEETRTLCVLCQQRDATTVVLATRRGIAFRLEAVLCAACSHQPPEYALLVPSAATESASEPAASSGSSEHKGSIITDTSGNRSSSPLPPPEMAAIDWSAQAASRTEAGERPIELDRPPEPAYPVALRDKVAARMAEQSPASFFATQMAAVMANNGKLQLRQRKANCCTGCCILLLFALFWILGAAISFTEGDDDGADDDDFLNDDSVCDEGFIMSDCDTASVADYLFSGPNIALGATNMPFAKTQYYDANGSYTVVSRPWVVWGSPGLFSLNASADSWQTVSSGQFDVTTRPTHTLFSSSSSPSVGALDANDILHGNAQAAQEDWLNSPYYDEYPECSTAFYSPTGEALSNMSVAQRQFRKYFTDAALDCAGVNASACTGDVGQFNGTVWTVTTAPSFSEYPNQFVNYDGSVGDGGGEITDDLLGWDCPPDMASYDSEYVINMSIPQLQQQITAQTMLNMLANSVVYKPGKPGSTDVQQTMQASVSTVMPLQYASDVLGDDDNDDDNSGTDDLAIAFIVMLYLLVVNAFWPMSVWRLSMERSSGLTVMMKSVGLQPLAYMVGNYLYDLLVLLLLRIAMYTFGVLLGLARYSDGVAEGYIATILGAHQIAAFSLFFVRILGSSSRFASTLSVLLVIMAAVGGVVLFTNFPSKTDWPWAFNLVPLLAEARALYSVQYNNGGDGRDYESAVSIMAISGSAFLALEAFLEFSGLNLEQIPAYVRTKIHTILHPRNVEYDAVHGRDRDVAVEKTRMEHATAEGPTSAMRSYAVALRNFWFAYPATKGSAPFLAVQGLSMGLEFGECYGLLGPNGAGKSTTMSVLSGLLAPGGGDVFVGGYDVTETKLPIYKLCGFCPQFDVVWPQLTVAEHLVFQARVRGVSASRISAEVQRVAAAVDLDGDAFRSLASGLSGGMMRRLSIGLSIVGDPPILCLDEPTTGLDPATRQSVWEIIEKLKSPNRLILITTHSMAEAEALCTRIGIMGRGKLCALGTSNHLKSRFGEGFTLLVNAVSESDLAGVHEFVARVIARGHPGLQLVSAVSRTRKYVIPREATTVAHVFDAMEKHKRAVGIREWGINMTSLEEVFISVAKRADEEEAAAADSSSTPSLQRV